MKREPICEEGRAKYPEALKVAREVAREHGYAIGLHGSMTYDLDLIAVPWVDKVFEPKDLAFAIADKLGWYLHPDITNKPQGRLAFLIYGPHGAHIDLSVMPSAQAIR